MARCALRARESAAAALKSLGAVGRSVALREHWLTAGQAERLQAMSRTGYNQCGSAPTAARGESRGVA